MDVGSQLGAVGMDVGSQLEADGIDRVKIKIVVGASWLGSGFRGFCLLLWQI